ncbi:uncharacterized protein Pyn_15698 [Prunus yedoensis var. nudiflora]|uniref:Uncharacterized protein n=1 Tax=Prunus yedoensis var. nudiflora TaxID=2094558 RepID=A0A314Y6P8_PRUYE|nr:uncharacterized protein Pyn_15698 [Prunus yedoensis var. nudiflora]
MATASSSSSRARTRSSGPVLRSLSPSGRFYTASNASISSSASGFASSTSSSFSSPASAFFSHHQDHHYYNQQINHHHHHRSASPTRVNLYTSSAPSPSVRFSIDHRSISPNHSNRSITVSKKNGPISMPKKTCMCRRRRIRGRFAAVFTRTSAEVTTRPPSPDRSDPSLRPPAEAKSRLPAEAEPALGHVHRRQQVRVTISDDLSDFVLQSNRKTQVPLAVVIIVTVFRYVCSVQSAVLLYKVALLFLQGVKLLTNFHGLLKALKFEKYDLELNCGSHGRNGQMNLLQHS